MKLDAPANLNYAATIIRVPVLVTLPGLDNLVGVPMLGHQALTQRDVEVGDLRVAFTAETQLSEGYACENDLHRDPELNKTDETGYLEHNRRIRALKLRGNVSNALLMPLSSLAYTGVDITSLKEGDTFDVLNGKPICKKYEIPVKASSRAKTKVERAFKRVDKKLFPEHLETDQFWRNKHLLQAGREVVVTQKLHGTSWRGGRVPVLRTLKWHEKLLRKLGVNIPSYEYDVVFGSRKVIKDPNNPNQEHFYESDLWTEYGQLIADLIPEGMIVYGELVGWVPAGHGSLKNPGLHNRGFMESLPADKAAEVASAPIQKNYTYHLPKGECELYVYRVAHINTQGHLSDLSWDGVKEFCRARGLKWTPELFRWQTYDVETELQGAVLNTRFMDWEPECLNEAPLPLSDKKTVDEGVCLRQEGIVPVILKSKNPAFLEHETKLLDKGEADLESMESAA